MKFDRDYGTLYLWIKEDLGKYPQKHLGTDFYFYNYQLSLFLQTAQTKENYMSNWFELDQDTWMEMLDTNEPGEPDPDDFRLHDPAYQEEIRYEEEIKTRQQQRESRSKELRYERIQREVDRRVNEWMNALIDFGIEFDSCEYKIAHARAIYKFMNELIPTILCPGCREFHICSDCRKCYNCDYGISFDDEFTSENFNERCETCNIT